MILCWPAVTIVRLGEEEAPLGEEEVPLGVEEVPPTVAGDLLGIKQHHRETQGARMEDITCLDRDCLREKMF